VLQADVVSQTPTIENRILRVSTAPLIGLYGMAVGQNYERWRQETAMSDTGGSWY
jgi:hypothetical protein